jgi:ketosteroid isomerase-like protein
MTNRTNRTNRSRGFLHRSLILVALAEAACGCVSTGEAQAKTSMAKPPVASEGDLRAVREAEQTWARSLLEGDAARLATIIAPEFSFIGPDGEYEDATAYLEGYRSLPRLGIRVTGIDMQEVKTRVSGDTAIVTGRVVARAQVQGSDIVENVRFTRVYARRGDAWQMIAGQGTRIAPPPASTAQAEPVHTAPRE